MRIGIDTFTIRDLKLDAHATLDWVKSNGLEGAQFGGVRHLVGGLDVGALRAVRAHADDLGLYTHVSVSSPNPLLGKFEPEVRRRQIEEEVVAAAAVGWHELHSALGGLDERYSKTIPWREQLAATTALFRALGPVLRANGSRIDLETHGDTTTFELVRLAQEVGPDICGICLDTANVFCFAEDPVAAARRAAPYTHLTHTKDGRIYLEGDGFTRQGRGPGQGQLNWLEILRALGQHAPDLPLSIEDHKWLFHFPVFTPAWHAEQPDLTREEFSAALAFAWAGRQAIDRGEWTNPEEDEKIPYLDQMPDRLRIGREHLRGVLTQLGL